MKKTFLSVIAAAAFGFSSLAFAEGGCSSFETVSTPEPITTVDTETSTPAPSQSPESG